MVKSRTRNYENWFEEEHELDTERLIFINEMWTSANVARRHSPCECDERLQFRVLHGLWKTKTLVGALTLRGFIAQFVSDGPIDGYACETHVDKVLVTKL